MELGIGKFFICFIVPDKRFCVVPYRLCLQYGRVTCTNILPSKITVRDTGITSSVYLYDLEGIVIC